MADFLLNPHDGVPERTDALLQAKIDPTAKIDFVCLYLLMLTGERLNHVQFIFPCTSCFCPSVITL